MLSLKAFVIIQTHFKVQLILSGLFQGFFIDNQSLRNLHPELGDLVQSLHLFHVLLALSLTLLF